MTSIDKSNMARSNYWVRMLQILAFLVPYFPVFGKNKGEYRIVYVSNQILYIFSYNNYMNTECLYFLVHVCDKYGKIQWYTVEYYYTILYILMIVETSCVHSGIGITFSCILVYSQVYFFKFHNFTYPMESFFLHICVFNGTLF